MRPSSSRISTATTSRSAASTAPAIAARGHEWTFPLAGGEITLTLPFTARHMAENTLAALVAYEALGLPLERAQAGADAIALSRWRGEELPLPGRRHRRQRRLQRQPDLDAGRARSTSSTRAGDRRRVAILGEMAELGAESPALPRGDRRARSTSSGSSS